MITIKEKFSAAKEKAERPIRIIQFGEGNFLRAFVDYFIDKANEKGFFDGSIAIVKPYPLGSVEKFAAQDNLYTVVLRGKQNGVVVNDSRVITSVAKAVSSNEDYDEYMALATLPTLRFAVSNTTEAGIALDTADHYDGLPETYPGKMTKFLYARYTHFNGDAAKGLIILPVELIENNGKMLKKYVLTLAETWKLGDGFIKWINESCIFTDTLVDRIVTGYPRADAVKVCEELGYDDGLVDIGEPFGLWVIESERDISSELPLDKAGLPVVFTDNLKPYRERKVRVLNGAHTASVLAGYLCGIDIVRDMMHDEVMGRFVRSVVCDEVVPHVNLDRADVEAFAASVFERFENPFIDHSLLSISLNSVSKWKARVLPSFRDYIKSEGKLPRFITFSFAALLAFYTASDIRSDGLYATRPCGGEYVIHDDAANLRFFAEYSGKSTPEYVKSAASNVSFWGEDLTKYDGFTDAVCDALDAIRLDARSAVRGVIGGKI